MESQGAYVPPSQNWPFLSNAEVVDNGFEIISMGFGEVGGVGERLVANALTTDIITDLHQHFLIRVCTAP